MAQAHPRVSTAGRVFVLGALLATLVGAQCGVLQTIVLSEPKDGKLIDEPDLIVAARMGRNHALATLEVRLDGVDLIGALGLTPPFFDESGQVLIGLDLIDVSGFTVDDGVSGQPVFIDVLLDQVPLGTHLVEVEAEKNGTFELTTRSADFERLVGFAQAAAGLSSGGLSKGPVNGGAGTLFSASLGQALAEEPIALSGGGSVRSGIVEVSEAVIAGAGP